jgi:hypothetical protein
LEINPEKGLGIHELDSISKVTALKFLQPACLRLDILSVLEKSGLGEPFGKASLANTAFGLGRIIPMKDRSRWMLEGRLGYSSEAWPDEALERGLAMPLVKIRKNWERAGFQFRLTISFGSYRLKSKQDPQSVSITN